MKILRNFGLGIVWALLSPFILVGAVLVAVYGIGVFLVEMIITIVNFFKGEKVFPLPKEDVEAIKVLQKALDHQGEAGTQVSNNTSTVMIQQNYYGPNGYPPYGGYPQGMLPPQGNPGYPGIPPQQMPGMIPPNNMPPQQQVPPLQSFPEATDNKEGE